VETLPRIEQKEMVRVALKAFNNIAKSYGGNWVMTV